MYTLAAVILVSVFSLWIRFSAINHRERDLYDRGRGLNGPMTDDATYTLLVHIRQDIALINQVLLSMGALILFLIAFIADGGGQKLAGMLQFLHLG